MQNIQQEVIPFSRPAAMTGSKRHGLGRKSLCLKHACIPEGVSVFLNTSNKISPLSMKNLLYLHR